jgi:hypothetical protein
MKKVLAIIVIAFLIALIPGVALAADPTTDPPLTIDLNISGGGTVNTNLTLSGTNVNANVNGSTLATLPDVQNMGSSLYGNIYGTASDLQNIKNSLTALIAQVKASEDSNIQGQGQTLNLYGDAITKLINDLSNLKKMQATDSFSTSNLEDLQAQFDSVSKDLGTLNDEINGDQIAYQQKTQSLTDNLEKLQASLNSLNYDTQANYKVLADAITASNQNLAAQQKRSEDTMTIAIVASDTAFLIIALTIVVIMKKNLKSKAENRHTVEALNENTAYSGK